jgi:hypothetical protein
MGAERTFTAHAMPSCESVWGAAEVAFGAEALMVDTLRLPFASPLNRCVSSVDHSSAVIASETKAKKVKRKQRK